MRRPVVPLMRSGNAFVGELIASRLPRLATVVRALNDLPEPAARLRRVKTVRVRRRSLDVVDLPSAEMRSAHIPAIARAVGRENETAFAGTHENSNAAHRASCCRQLTAVSCQLSDARRLTPVRRLTRLQT